MAMTGIRVVQDAFPNRRHDVPKHGLQIIKRISLSHVVGIIVPITEPLAVGRILPICDFAAHISNYIIKTAAQIATVADSVFLLPINCYGNLAGAI